MNRRGVSPMLSVIILIAIATVGGGLIFNVQNQFLTVGLNQIELRVLDLSLQKDAKGSCYFQTFVQNSGTEPINKINMKTTLDSGEDFEFSVDNFGPTLIPNNSTKDFDFMSYDDNICGNFTLSNTYSFRVNASSADSTFATIKSLKVSNVTGS